MRLHSVATKRKPTKKKPGRPRSAPKDQHQQSIWLPNRLYEKVKARLKKQTGSERMFSALVERLLRRWLDSGESFPQD
jgi:hypothetical protein